MLFANDSLLSNVTKCSAATTVAFVMVLLVLDRKFDFLLLVVFKRNCSLCFKVGVIKCSNHDFVLFIGEENLLLFPSPKNIPSESKALGSNLNVEFLV